MNWLGKPWFKSMTVWGVVLLGSVEAAERTGLVPDGTHRGVSSALANASALVQAIGGLLVVLGLRRAATAPNVAVETTVKPGGGAGRVRLEIRGRYGFDRRVRRRSSGVPRWRGTC